MNPFTYIESDEDFHAGRKNRIGSSDIPVLAGLYAHWDKTPVSLWMEKTGRAESFQGNNKTKWGNHLEPLVLREFCDNHGKKKAGEIMAECHQRGKPYGRNGLEIMTTCFHPQYPFAVAHADMLNTKGDTFISCPKCGHLDEYNPGTIEECHGENCDHIIKAPDETIPYIVEAKTTGFYAGKRREANDFGWSKEDKGEGGIPAAVYLQIQWQMFVYGIGACWSAVLIDTSDYNEYGIIYANKSIQEKCLAMAVNFNDCIINDTPPEPKIFKDIGLLFPKNNKTTLILSGSQLEQVELMKKQKSELEADIKKKTKKVDEIKTAVGAIMGENYVLGTPDGKKLGTLSRISGRKTISLPELKKQLPDEFQKIEEKGLIKQGDDYSRLNF